MNINDLLALQYSGLPEDSPVEIIIKYHGSLSAIASELNAVAEPLNEIFAILTLPLANARDITDIVNIEYYELPKNVFYQLRTNLDITNISQVQRESGFGLRGNGVIVGIVDSGIDYTHPDFRTENGTRIEYLWDQTASGSPPSGFRDGMLYTREDINLALADANPYSIVAERDTLGHGTAVAGIAAGNGRASEGANIGVAPDSALIIVKLNQSARPGFTKSTDIMRGVKFCIDTAEALEKPVAVNISYGTSDGAHDGTSLFEEYIDSAALRWKNTICVASGNEASAGHHYRNTLASGETDNIAFSVGENIRELYLFMLKDFADTFSYELISPSGGSSGVITPQTEFSRFTLDNACITVFNSQPSNYSFNQEVKIIFEGVNGAIRESVWYLNVIASSVVSGVFDIWLPMTDAVTEETFFSVPDPENTASIPSTAFGVITVGAYNSSINSGAFFSGRGKRYISYGQKPDLTAPGVNVISASVGGGYDSYSGTSVAAPFVTGSCALIMEWGIVQGNDPFLYGQKIKAYLCRNAERDFPVSYPNSIWGYGVLDLNATMNDLVLFDT